MRNYIKVSDIPKELEEILKILNLLPSDLKRLESDLLELGLRFNAECSEHPNHSFDLMDIYAGKVCDLIAPDLVSQIDKLKKGDYMNGRFQLQRFINERMNLVTVIRSYTAAAGLRNLKQDFVLAKKIAAFHFNEDSTIHLSSFRVIEILTRNKIQIKRLLICPVCNEIAWLKNINHKTCGKQKCIDGLQNQKKKIKRLKQKSENETKKKERQKWLNKDFSKEESTDFETKSIAINEMEEW